MPPDRRGDPALDHRPGAEPPIAPVAFQPLGAGAPGRSRRHPGPLALALGAALLVAIAVLGFVLGARGVIIDTEPSDARVRLEGGLAVHWRDHWLAWPGAYEVSASAPGHRDLTRKLEITDAAAQRHRLVLEKLPGHLALSSTPAGARVLLDGESRGTTPLQLADLRPGTYRLEVRHPRYRTLTREIEVAGGDQILALDLQLEPAWGQVRVDSRPSGARVLVAGTPVGNTPAEVPVVAGEELRLELDGYRNWQRSLDLAPGERRDLGVIDLAPADASLRLLSDPPGASVTLNGHHRGRTPLTLEVSPGQTHQVVLFLPGHADASREIRLTSGQTRTLEVQLEPRLGQVEIQLQPEDAELYIDGRRYAGASHRLELPARPHQLRVERAGYLAEARTLTPTPGAPQTLRIALRTPEQARLAALPDTLDSPAGGTLRLFRPAATFTLGAGRREQGRRSDQVEHKVSLQRPFYLGTHEVTNAQYKRFDPDHSSSHAGGNTLDLARQPVVRVSWIQAVRFCNWLSERAGLEPFYRIRGGRVTGVDAGATGYRLPTEAEWAWAARIDAPGRRRTFPWGEAFPPATASENIAGSEAGDLVAARVPGIDDGFPVSAPVGSFPANAKGLWDLGGNVAEWVHDRYAVPLAGAPVTIDPLGPEDGTGHVIRGPSWRHGGLVELRLAYRAQGESGRDDLGFRLARYAE